MNATLKRATLAQLDGPRITAELDKEGYAPLPQLLDAEEARALAAWALDAGAKGLRESLDMRELGHGALWRLTAPLPDPLTAWREAFHTLLMPVARRWNETMGIASSDSAEPGDVPQRDRSHATLTRLRAGDHQALHQSAEGAGGFPLQLVVLLSEPGTDFTGGEFVMTEQRPRMQSRPMVLPLRLGDAALITVAHRPFKGASGYYRVNLRHAISRVRSGERLGLELLLDDGPGPRR